MTTQNSLNLGSYECICCRNGVTLCELLYFSIPCVNMHLAQLDWIQLKLTCVCTLNWMQRTVDHDILFMLYKDDDKWYLLCVCCMSEWAIL